MGWLSNIFSTIGNLGKNLWQGIGGAGAKVGQAVTQQAIPSVMSMFNQGQPTNKQPQSQGGGNVLSNLIHGVNPQFNQSGGQGISQPQSIGGNKLFNSINQIMGMFGNSQNQQNNQPSIPQQQVQQTKASSGGSPLGGIMDSLFSKNQGGGINIPQIGMGMALPLIGGAMAPKVKVPDLSQLPGYQRMAQLQTRNFSQMDPELEAALQRDIKSSNDAEDRQFVARWKNLRPGADLESDSVFAREWQNYKQQQAENNSGIMAKQRFANIQNNLQASKLEMDQLAQLARADTYTIMMQLGLDAQAAEDFKSVFSNIGQQFLSEGMGNNQSVLSMFGGQ